MSGCFLFFRFWPGFDFDQFPVDLFNGIADEDLPAALACYAGEEIRRPEVRHRIKEVVKARRQKLIAGFRKESASRMMVGARDVGVRKRLTKRDWYWPRIRRAERGDLLVCRLGAYLGWWQKGEAWSESLPFGPQVWFSRVSSPELAEAFVSHLNGRTGLDYDGNEVELHFRPRFGFVEDADTALQISAQRCINAIGRGQYPDVRGSKAALAMGRKAMAIADEMLEATAPPTPVQAVSTPPAPDQANGNADSTTAKQDDETTDDNGQPPAADRLSVDAIDRCGLNTDSPKLPDGDKTESQGKTASTQARTEAAKCSGQSTKSKGVPAPSREAELRPIDLKYWAVGQYEKGWKLFNFSTAIKTRENPKGRWIERGDVQISDGKCHKLAEAFAKNGGSLTPAEAKKAVDGRDLKSAKVRLCRAIEQAILGANSKSKPNATVRLPIEYDRPGKSYQCVVKIGHTEQDDDGRLSYYDEEERRKALEGELI